MTERNIPEGYNVAAKVTLLVGGARRLASTADQVAEDAATYAGHLDKRKRARVMADLDAAAEAIRQARETIAASGQA